MAKIFIVEDEENIADLIRLNLELEGHDCEVIGDGLQAQKRMSEFELSDLVILDIMLPNVSGLDLCSQIRKQSKVPVLMLSARGSTSDRINGLKTGANDYLPKPFDLEELLLRVSNLLPQDVSEEITIGEFTLNWSSFECRDQKGNVVMEFGKREIGLLKLFWEREGQVVSRDEILDRLWGKEQTPTSRTIDNLILSFRKVFETNPKEPKFFHSIRGVGYKFTI